MTFGESFSTFKQSCFKSPVFERLYIGMVAVQVEILLEVCHLIVNLSFCLKLEYKQMSNQQSA